MEKDNLFSILNRIVIWCSHYFFIRFLKIFIWLIVHLMLFSLDELIESKIGPGPFK